MRRFPERRGICVSTQPLYVKKLNIHFSHNWFIYHIFTFNSLTADKYADEVQFLNHVLDFFIIEWVLFAGFSLYAITVSHTLFFNGYFFLQQSRVLVQYRTSVGKNGFLALCKFTTSLATNTLCTAHNLANHITLLHFDSPIYRLGTCGSSIGLSVRYKSVINP